MKIAGYSITEREMVALHGIYKGVLQGTRVYGTQVFRQLEALANRGIIDRSGAGTYTIPYRSPGAAIINATPDFTISQHL